MCGIAGVIQKSFALGLPELLNSMSYSMKNRGPDDEGSQIFSYQKGNYQVGLCHRRLKVVDLSKEGSPPFNTEDGRYSLVYNGEIYNFKEIRKELSQLGDSFKRIGNIFFFISCIMLSLSNECTPKL